MGWKGTLRSINAAAKRAERAEKRRQKELDALYKHQEKMEELDRAAYEVRVFENYVNILQSVHKDCSDSINWNHIAVSLEPEKPNLLNEFEQEAIYSKEKYRPSLIDKLFRRIEKKIEKFDESILLAKNKDRERYQSDLIDWENERLDWSNDVSKARAILDGIPEAKISIIKEINPFDELVGLGSKVHFIYIDGLLHVNINVFSEDVVPSEHKGLLKNGKLSVKKMPIGRFYEIYQDHVCSVVIRVAREIFALLPDEAVLINARDMLLDKSTGHLSEQNILSVYVSRSTLSSLNIDTIDPSDSMKNFIHNMSFKKTKGFEPVNSVDVSLFS